MSGHDTFRQTHQAFSVSIGFCDNETLLGPGPGSAEGEGLARRLLSADRIRKIRYLDPMTKRTVIALCEALERARLVDVVRERPFDFGCFFGVERGPRATRGKFRDGLIRSGGRSVSATLFAQCGYNMTAALTALVVGLRGPNLTLAADANLPHLILSAAARMLRRGNVQTAICAMPELPARSTMTTGNSDDTSSTVVVLRQMQHCPLAINRANSEPILLRMRENKRPVSHGVFQTPLEFDLVNQLRNGAEIDGLLGLERTNFANRSVLNCLSTGDIFSAFWLTHEHWLNAPQGTGLYVVTGGYDCYALYFPPRCQ
jgi:hypothetical protein